MAMQIRSIRLPDDLVERLKHLSLRESLRRKAPITWTGLLREVAQDFVGREQAKGGPPRNAE